MYRAHSIPCYLSECTVLFSFVILLEQYLHVYPKTLGCIVFHMVQVYGILWMWCGVCIC